MKTYHIWCARWTLQPELCYRIPIAWLFLVVGIVLFDINPLKALRIRL